MAHVVNGPMAQRDLADPNGPMTQRDPVKFNDPSDPMTQRDPVTRQTHRGGFGCTKPEKDRVDQNSTRREEHGNNPVGASSFLMSCM